MRRSPLILVPLALTLAACGGSAADKVVARVGAQTVHESGLEAMLEFAKARTTEERAAFPKEGSAEFEAIRKASLAQLVTLAIFREKASQVGVHAAPDEIQQAAATVESEAKGKDDAAAEQTKRNLGELGVLRRKLYAYAIRGVTVSDAEVRNYAKAHPGNLTLARAAVLAQKRAAAGNAFFERLAHEYKVTYSSG